MEFAYLQKLTLVDYPGTVAATVFTVGCNFRCPFCHNPELVIPPFADAVYTQEKIISFLNSRKGKLQGLCITGGEPTLHGKVLGEFIKEVKTLGYKVKLDTNGSHPDVLEDYINNGLVDYVAMDIKTSPKRYHLAIGLSEEEGRMMVNKISQSLRILRHSGLPFELRTTAVPDYVNQEDFDGIAKWIEGAPLYAIQRYHKDKVLDSSSLPPQRYTYEDLQLFADIVRPYVNSVIVRW